MKKRQASRFKGLPLAWLGAAVIAAMLSGCAGNSASPAAESSAAPAESAISSPSASPSASPEPLPPVELTYYFPGPPQKDIQLVEDELNKLIQPQINATVKLNMIDFGNYDQKMNVMISSGEQFDLAFTASWINNFNNNAAKGAFMPLDELLPRYAPKTLAALPAGVEEAARVNGQLYGVINYQIMGTAYGIGVQKALAEKYGFDWRNATKAEDLEPFLAAVKAGEPTKTPLEYSTVSDIFTGAAPLYGFDVISDQKSPGWVRLADEAYQVVNQYETDEFKRTIALMHDWYNKGYVKKDAATTKDVSAERKAAKYAAIFPNYMTTDNVDKPDEPAGVYPGSDGVEGVNKRFTEAIITTDRATATMTAISKTSKNPERAMMFIELLNSDPQVSNLLNWGIEGTHYNKTADNRIEQVENSGYNPQIPWVFGNNTLIWLLPTQPDTFVADWDQVNKTADVSPILGFTFNPEPVKSEIAQSQSVIDQYLASLTSGTANPEEIQPEFIAKLKTAGADKIIAEKQKQLDEWRKVNGK